MMKKVIAVAGADLHIHNWKQFNENGQRTLTSLDQLRLAARYCRKYSVPFLFCGDLFHNPQEISNKLNTLSKIAFKTFFEKPKIPFVAISGNHDMSQINYKDKPSPSHLGSFDTVFSSFYQIDFKSYEVDKNTMAWGIPYLNHNRGLDEAIESIKQDIKGMGIKRNILMLHTDLPGAQETSGEVVNTAKNIDPKMKVFKGFDLVISGHIHKHQRLKKNVYMLGAMQQQSRKDKSCQMGISLIHADFSITFIPTNYPEFKTYKASEHPNGPPDLFHYYDALPDEVDTEEEIRVSTRYLDNRVKLIEDWASDLKVNVPERRLEKLKSLITKV